MLNRVILMGRLTRDPEYKQTAAGTAVCRISLAIDRKFANKETGEREADFVECDAWRSTADFIARYFSKGNPILVEGELRNNNYTDNNGVKHYGMRVLIDSVSFCGSKADNNGSGQQQAGTYAAAGTPQPQQSSGYNALHDMPRRQQEQRPATAAPADEPMSIGDLGEFEEILNEGELPF